jgi:hypothetical protein
MFPQSVSPNPTRTTSRFTPIVPNEIWRFIFRFATITPDLDFGYVPCQHQDKLLDIFVYFSRANIRFTAGLVLVCKNWRALALEFLYEDVRLRDSRQTRCFLDALVRSTNGKEMSLEGLGKYVRRLQLPIRNVNDLSRRTHVRLVDIVSACTNLEILIRPPYLDEIDDLHFWRGLTTAPGGLFKLASLKRVD